MTTQHTGAAELPEAIRLAEILEGDYCPDWFYEQGVDEVAAELRRLHTYCMELESQVIADCMTHGTGAKVEALRAQPAAVQVPEAVLQAIRAAGMHLIRGMNDVYSLIPAMSATAQPAGAATPAVPRKEWLLERLAKCDDSMASAGRPCDGPPGCTAHNCLGCDDFKARPSATPAAPAPEVPEDLAELSMLNQLIELGAKAAGFHATSNSDDGAKGTTAHVQWHETRAKMGELIRSHYAAAPQPPAAAQEPFAWESTTPAYNKFITQSRYEKFSPEMQRWYKPFMCSSCAALVEAQQPAPSAAEAAGNALPEGWVPLVITHEGQYPEEVAYGPQILMDRLGKWLRKYFDHVVASKAQADSQPAPVETGCWACNDTGMVTASSNGSGLIDEKCQACSADRASADSVTAPAGAEIERLRAQVESLTRDCGRQASKIAELIADLKFQDGKHREDRAQLQTIYEHQRGECWYWQGDGQDHLESLCNTLPVVIRADQLRALVTTPPAQAADSVLEDAARLDWLDQQREAYGFQDIHEGNRWEISGAYANVREAIDAARKQGANHD